MLKLFEVKGFKNFKERVTINFSEVRDYKFNKQCLTNDFISKMIIYGKNSTGKSNLGLAIFDIVSHLSDKHVTPNLYDYYLNAMNVDDYAEFRYIFTFKEKDVEYTYYKDGEQKLIYEKIKIDDNLLFEYDYQQKKGSTDGLKQIAPTLNWAFNSVESILKYVINNTVLEETHPLRLMARYVNNMLWFRSLDENRYIGYKEKSNDYFEFMFDSEVLDEFQALLRQAGIMDPISVNQNYDGKKMLFFNSGATPLPFFKVASNGTKALYTFFYWYKTAKDVSLMFIDEFDAFYHFELSETVVSLLERMTDTQVIITSHNTNLLSNRIMRPDCYLILTENKLTSISKATDRELREGHNLEKLYMSGEFNG